MTGSASFWFGVLGGLITEFVGVSRHRVDAGKEWPQHLRSAGYWAMGAGWILLGGVFAWLYQGQGGVQLSRLLAVNIGATAPLLAEQLARTLPKPETGSVR